MRLNLPSRREEELLQDYAFTPLLCKTFVLKALKTLFPFFYKIVFATKCANFEAFKSFYIYIFLCHS